VVNGDRDAFFAHTALATDEDGRGKGGQPNDDAFERSHCLAVPKDIFVATGCCKVPHRGPNCPLDVVGRGVLVQDVSGARPHDVDHGPQVARLHDRNDGDLSAARQAADKVSWRGECEIDDNDARRDLLGSLEPFGIFIDVNGLEA
jgi:hypothetical protein